ncbi:MAG: 3D domain-containing protein [Flavobacteriaceae bacterium]|nr:3D domain-containing protein [Flavobacteriaceae bacterium]
MKQFIIVFLLLIINSCHRKPVEKYNWHTITVTATAYNSLKNQTSSNPHITAWGDSLLPGKKYIAVSRDLIGLGLKHNTPVKIDGYEELFIVKDKMHRRWKNRIDIYMGLDVKKAKTWGKRKIEITYGILKDEDHE